MTGKDIAANLRSSKRKWGRGSFFHNGAFCAVGLKLREAGVPLRALVHPTFAGTARFGLEVLTCLNDDCGSKQQLIDKLESPPYRDRDFPIEAYAKAVLRELGKKQAEATA